MKGFKKNTYIYIYINRIVTKALNNVEEKYAIKTLSTTTFKEIFKRKRHYLLYDSKFMSRKMYDLVYPCYFQHG